jgi:hypothetical protein
MFSFISSSFLPAYFQAATNATRQACSAATQTSLEGLYTDVVKSVTLRLAKHFVTDADVRKFLDLVLNVFETTILTVQDLSHAASSTQVVSALLRSFKMLTGKNVISSAIDNGKWIVDKLKEISASVVGSLRKKKTDESPQVQTCELLVDDKGDMFDPAVVWYHDKATPEEKFEFKYHFSVFQRLEFLKAVTEYEIALEKYDDFWEELVHDFFGDDEGEILVAHRDGSYSVQTRIQSEEVDSTKWDFGWCVKGARSLLDNYKSIRGSPLITKLHSLLKYFLTFGLFSIFGLDFASFGFKDFEVRKTKQEYGSRESFFYTIFEDVVWFLERGQQAISMGSFMPFLHTSVAYGKFIKDADQLLEDQIKMNNPEAFGFDEHNFHSRLDSCIERAAQIEKVMDKKNVVECSVLRKTAHELRMMKMQFQSKDYAQRDRKPPFTVLVVGDSDIAKTQFTQILFQHYGKVHHKDISAENMWTRNSCDKFYSGYRTSKWCIRLDDVAQFSPELGTLDPTLADMIMLGNGVSFTAPMADLEDKGIVAVRPELLIGTTNVEDLNAHAYFSCPLALRRRFPYVIELTVKKDFRKKAYVGDTLCSISTVDPALIPPTPEGEYMNIWDIKLAKLVAQPGSQNPDDSFKARMSSPKLELVARYDNIEDFLAYYAALSLEHNEHQTKGQRATESMRAVEICDGCYHTKKGCICLAPVVQTHETTIAPVLTPDDVAHYRAVLGLPAEPGEMRIPLRLDEEYDDLVAHPTRVVAGYQDILQDPIAPNDIDMTDYRSMAVKTLDWIDDRASELVCMAKIVAMSTKKLITKPREAYNMAIKMGYNIADSAMARFSDLVVIYQLKKVTTMFENIGAKIQTFCSSWRIATFAALLALAWGVWKSVGFFSAGLKETRCDCEPDCSVRWSRFRGVRGTPPASWKREKCKGAACEDCGDTFLQGGASEFARDEKPNPWIKDEMILSEFYVPSKTKGWKGLSREHVLSRLCKNVVSIRSEYERDGQMAYKPATALCLHGHIYVTGSHCIPEDVESVRMFVSDMPESGNINSNFDYLVQQSAILRIPSKDLAFFQCRVTPPRADLRDLFLKQRFEQLVCNGAYIHCKFHSVATTNALDCIRFEVPDAADVRLPGWFGELTYDRDSTHSRNTELGDCGSPMVGFTPAGPMILGLHRTLTGHTVGAPDILRSDIQIAEDFFGQQIQCGKPSFAAEKLGPLNHKSVLLWEDKGQARVYGSTGRSAFRCDRKSRVADTFISKAAQELGFVQRCGPPVMAGPEVWHNNVEPTVTQSYAVDATMLKDCVDCFVEDITSRLDEKSLSELVVLDDVTALNGLDGVKFLDKINRDTSMGYPYRKSKRNFLSPIARTSDHMDAMEYAEEIMEEVALIRDVYSRGERYMPVFVMSLKDDPLPYAKIAIKKTRGFMGGPAAWQFVCRKYLLSFVRIFQLNPLIFEGAPGLNCNSESWDELQDFLTAFGLNNLYAGDFGWYDKKMSPEFILAGYDVIIGVLRKAGWPEELLRIVRCIGEDVAFPCADIQGDFVEFFGSNPSGHAITVILNCIVNCLYMRYCYAKLSPDHSPMTFKEFVHLITYGDDNAGGVSPKVPWFNHTAIAAELAKIKVVYTMADKHAESVPFVNIADITFLKRSFVPRVERDGRHRVACPLAWESIEKMLTSCVVSKSVCPEKQAMDSMRSAIGEFFQYGEEVFDENVKKMHQIVEMCHLEFFVQPSTFPSYKELLDAHFEASGLEIHTCSLDLEHESNTFEPTGDLQCDLKCMTSE